MRLWLVPAVIKDQISVFAIHRINVMSVFA